MNTDRTKEISRRNLIYFFFKFYFIFKLYITVLVLPNIKMNPPQGIHVFPILNPPPSSLPIPSLLVVPVHQPQASSIVHWTWTGDSFHIWYYTYFNAIHQIIPPSPSPTESKRLFYTSVSLLQDSFLSKKGSFFRKYQYLLIFSGITLKEKIKII